MLESVIASASRLIAATLTVVLLPACTAIPAPKEGPAQVRYRAAGNEPFWSVEVDDAMLVLKTPQNLEGTEIRAERIIDRGDTVFTQRDFDTPFILRLKPGPCQDSMADKTWDYTASFGHGGQTLQGCGGRIE